MSGMQNVDDLYPLTPTQAGMLFQCLRDEDPELYFEQVRAELRGEVDADRIERAFGEVTRRHPALRTAIVWEGLEQPLQVVRGEVDLPLEVLHRPGIDDAGLARLAQHRRRTPFDVRKAPLQRLALVDSGDRAHLLWEFHHIICDGWSAAIVLDEVLAAYNGTLGVEPAAPFRDFLAWHAGQDAEATSAYWKQLLNGLTDPTPLALPRSSEDTGFLAGQHTQTIPGDLLHDLTRFARSRRVTLNTLVQAAWSIVQSRYSGSDDVVFGVTTSGRPAVLPGVESTVGMFLNTLPMRANVAPGQTVEDFLVGLQEQQLASTEHATASLADLHRLVGFRVGEEMFDTMLVFENFPRPVEDPSAQLALTSKSVFEQTNHPLTLMVGVVDDEFELVANYDRNRFADGSIRTVMSQFSHVLGELTRLDVATLSQIDFFTPQDEARFRQWQGPHLEIDTSATVISVLLETAAKVPDNVALIDADASLTFSELMSRSQVVADRLIELGVGPEVPVAICIPRRIDMVVAVVGTLLAGGIYVPLDPRFPKARLDLMLDVSGAQVALTAAEVAEALPDRDGLHIIDVGGLRVSVPAGPAEIRVGAHNTMVLAFTSGSTGVPKGVRIHHRGSLNRLSWQWSRYPVEDDEVFAQKTTLGFMDHNWELWGGLLKGRPVLLLDDETVTDLDRFIDSLAAHPIRRLSLVPSLLDLMLDHAPDLGRRLPDLRTWTVSGEALSVATADRFAEVMPHATLLNFYGMSEATQDATYAEIEPGSSDVPIGRPMANFEIQLLDDHDRRVPVGVPGQLHVSGIGLSPGYWKRPDLTAERFVPNPMVAADDDPNATMYRSGDIARWRSDGVLEYLGRSDHQVKVRGIRIELGEVETAIASHPGVERAVVVGRAAANGSELIGYVVGVGHTEVDTSDVLDHVALRLPAVMVPTQLVVLDDFPLLPNGKVDRSELPAPVKERRSVAGPSGPLSETERRMLGVWREVMDDPGLGPDDDFFDHGGHSMMAMRLVSHIKRDLGFAVPLAQLLRSGTVRSLTSALASTAAGSDGNSGTDHRHLVPMLEPDPALPNIFVVHGAGGDVLNLRALGRHLNGLANVIGVQAAGVDGISELHTSRDEMVHDYLGDIRAFQTEGPYLIGGFSIGGLIAVELARALHEHGHSVERVILFDVFHPSVRARQLSVAELLSYLRARGPSYGMEQVAYQWRKHVGDRWTAYRLRRARSPKHRGDDALVPFELRKSEITDNTVRIWFGHTPGHYVGRVLLLSADETYDVWDHVPRHREWSGRVDELDVVHVPGNHLTLVEEPHVAVLARRLIDALELHPLDG